MRGGLRHEGEGAASTSGAKGGAGPKELEAGGELEGVTGIVDVPDTGVKEVGGDPGNAGSKKGQERAGDGIRANAREDKVAIIGTERAPRVDRLNVCGCGPIVQKLIGVAVEVSAVVEGDDFLKKALKAPEGDASIGAPVVTDEAGSAAQRILPDLKGREEAPTGGLPAEKEGPDRIEPRGQVGRGEDGVYFRRIVEI
jgi:hypothetical protein